MKRSLFLLILFVMLFGCLNPVKETNYIPSKVITEIKYPIKADFTYKVEEGYLKINTKPSKYENAKISYMDEVTRISKYDTNWWLQGFLALAFGINIPYMAGEYIYYKKKYPITNHRNKINLLKNQGSNGISLDEKVMPFYFVGKLKENEQTHFRIPFQDLKNPLYNLRRHNNVDTTYSIQYDLCDDLRVRKTNIIGKKKVEVKECKVGLGSININTIQKELMATKIGKDFLVNRIDKEINEDRKQEARETAEKRRQEQELLDILDTYKYRPKKYYYPKKRYYPKRRYRR
ncbi:MAG: hypothetical protein KDK90_15905 [Leptospiraceae bacterium]|nr:hypothetical protein [Leptospiraceae bacterium]